MNYRHKRCLAWLLCLTMCFATVRAAEALPYTDVAPDAADAVRFVTERGLMNGVGDGQFAPNENVTRAMMVTILHRFAGSPQGHGYNEFIDVEDGAWYTDTIIWASNDKIVLGYGNGRFGTNDPVTRLQLAVMLRRLAAIYRLDTSQRVNDMQSRYEDNSSDYGDGATYESMQWAVALELITPRTPERIDAAQPATRLEVAAALQTLVSYYGEDAFQNEEETPSGGRTEWVYLEDATTRGYIEVTYLVTFRYADGTEESQRVISTSSTSAESLPEQVRLPLLRNYRKEGPDADSFFFPQCMRADCVGVTVSVQTITFGRNTDYPTRYLRVNSGKYTQDRLMFDSDFYAGEVQVYNNSRQIQISCQKGAFSKNTEISLVLERPTGGGTDNETKEDHTK